MLHCPNCGGGLRFEIESQQMACDHCGSRLDPASIDNVKYDAKSAEVFDSYVFLCPSCGAELITTDETDAIGFCPFCGGASMLCDRIRQQWRPDCVIPFQITKDQCKELYVKAAKRSFFTSRKYSDPMLIDGFRGIYMPFWEYRGEHKGSYQLKGKTKGVFLENEYSVRGDIDYTVDGYAHDASVAFDDRISENITPYDISMHKPFAPGYLSGFYADIGDVDQTKYYKKSGEWMAQDIAETLTHEKAVRRGKEVRSIKIDKKSARIPTHVSGARRVLYPVWFMSYRNGDNITYASVNGQTGKVSADFPISPLRVLIAVLALGLVLTSLVFIMPAIKANLTLLITSLLLMAGFVTLNRNHDRAVNPESGLDKTEEAKRFEKWEWLRALIVIASFIAGVVVFFLDPAYNVISYSLCFLMAAELFVLMIQHIRFQIAIAKRRPPQFNKKGAEYDEK